MNLKDPVSPDLDYKEKEIPVIDDVECTEGESASADFERRTMCAVPSTRQRIWLKLRTSGDVWISESFLSLDLCLHWH